MSRKNAFFCKIYYHELNFTWYKHIHKKNTSISIEVNTIILSRKIPINQIIFWFFVYSEYLYWENYVTEVSLGHRSLCKRICFFIFRRYSITLQDHLRFWVPSRSWDNRRHHRRPVYKRDTRVLSVAAIGSM